MHILQIHNYYQIAGGEDAVLEYEKALLIKNNHVVMRYCCDNKVIDSFLKKLITTIMVPFNIIKYFEMLKVLKKCSPDVVHVHNYFPLISPAVFFACKKMAIPVVHTLHNYRAVCPTALLMHNGKVNERSIKKSSWWAVCAKVYRNSYIGSFSLVAMVELHKWLGSWQSTVNRFIALTDFSRKKYIEAGWPSNKITVKSNFIYDPFNGAAQIENKGGYAIYVGRLSEEKGLNVLFNAWESLNVPLKVIGDGPLKSTVESTNNPNIEYLGYKEKDAVIELVKHANCIIMPSLWYEGFPMTIVEAFACGTPAIVSKLGSMEEIVTHEKTGLHFEPGNCESLKTQVEKIMTNPSAFKGMAEAARQEYLAKYTKEKNYEMLISIYQQVINEVQPQND